MVLWGCVTTVVWGSKMFENMKIDEFIKKYNIAIFVAADLVNKRFDIIKTDVGMESYDLFEQLILFSDTESISEYISGQLLPRIWSQGKTKCVMSQPNDKQIIALFYDSCLDANDHYLYAKQLHAAIKTITTD